MVYIYFPVLKIKVRYGKPHELRNTQPGVEQDINPVIISGKMRIRLDELQKAALLFSGDSLPCHAVIDHYCGKLELKGILPDVIIIHGHLESRPYHASHGFYAAVSPAVFL